MFETDQFAFSLADFSRAQELIYDVLNPTPQINWPLLSERCGCEVWLKHENHLPTGAFKVRGGLVFMDYLRCYEPTVAGVVAATRGNHGQSVAFAAGRAAVAATIVTPCGNNVDKNRAMRGYGAELIEHGEDFDAAFAQAKVLADERGLRLFPSFDPRLVLGVGTYAVELFNAVADLDRVYVPIGLGSGICGLIAARDALGLKTRIIGVVSTEADGYAQSFAAGKVVETPAADTFADGLAVRVPNPIALEIISAGADDVVSVSDASVKAAIAVLFNDTHNIAEGAGAAALAALMQDRHHCHGKRVGVVLSGGNIDRAQFARILTDCS